MTRSRTLRSQTGLRRLAQPLLLHPVAFVTWAVIVAGWEVAAHLTPKSQLQGSPIVPSFEFMLTDAFKSLSGSWTFHRWAPNPAYGGRETYLGATLAVAYHTWKTLTRVLLGLAAGGLLGVFSGLLVSYSRVARAVLWGPLNFLRMVPLLAAIPLFQYWLGPNNRGTTVFIGIGVFVLLIVATINAVSNVPNYYAESARTLGASRLQTYARVIIPRAIPELRTAILLSAGLSWSLAVGSEYLGLQNGVGSIMATAANTSNTGRMIVVGVLIMFCALITFFVLNRLFTKVVHWMPTVPASAVSVASGAASAGGGRAVTARSTTPGSR
jgi:ABC-type nitrate/sulfonate/bicarbonate transport system permease component